MENNPKINTSKTNNYSFSKLISESKMKFDYEVSSVKFNDENNSDDQIYFYDKPENGKNYGKINKFKFRCFKL